MDLRPVGPLFSPFHTGPGHHRLTASPNKIDIIVRRALADKTLAEELLAKKKKSELMLRLFLIDAAFIAS